MIWTVGFSLYALALLFLIWSIKRNQSTTEKGDCLDNYIADMTGKLTEKAGSTVFTVTVLSLVLSLVAGGVGWLLQRYLLLPASAGVYILNGGWVSLIVPSLLSFTLAFEFLFRSKWKRYAVSALYLRNVAPPCYRSRKRFLILQTVFFAVAFPFYIFSLGSYVCFSDSEIRYSEYFSPVEHRYPYSDVQQTETKPFTDNYGNPDMLYTIGFQDGKTVSFRLSDYPEDVPKMQNIIEKMGS